LEDAFYHCYHFNLPDSAKGFWDSCALMQVQLGNNLHQSGAGSILLG